MASENDEPLSGRRLPRATIATATNFFRFLDAAGVSLARLSVSKTWSYASPLLTRSHALCVILHNVCRFVGSVMRNSVRLVSYGAGVALLLSAASPANAEIIQTSSGQCFEVVRASDGTIISSRPVSCTTNNNNLSLIH